MSTLPLHTVPKTLGETPETMQAIVIRKEREGDPMQSMKGRRGAGARARAPTTCSCSSWPPASTSTACGPHAGKPVSSLQDAQGAVSTSPAPTRRASSWKVGKEVTSLEGRTTRSSSTATSRAGSAPSATASIRWPARERKNLGLRDIAWGSVRAVHPRSRRSSSCTSRSSCRGRTRRHTASPTSRRIACSYGRAQVQAGRQRAGVGRRRRPRHLRPCRSARSSAPIRSRWCRRRTSTISCDRSAPTRHHQPQETSRLRWRPERDARADQEAHGRDQAPRRTACSPSFTSCACRNDMGELLVCP